MNPNSISTGFWWRSQEHMAEKRQLLQKWWSWDWIYTFNRIQLSLSLNNNNNKTQLIVNQKPPSAKMKLWRFLYCMEIELSTLFIIDNAGINPDVHQWVNGWGKRSVHTIAYHSVIKEQNTAICCVADGTRGNYVKWNNMHKVRNTILYLNFWKLI